MLTLHFSLFNFSTLSTSTHFFRPLCFSVSVSVCLSVCLSVSLSVPLSVSLSVCLCLSVFFSFSLSLIFYLSISISLYLSLSLSLSVSNQREWCWFSVYENRHPLRQEQQCRERWRKTTPVCGFAAERLGSKVHREWVELNKQKERTWKWDWGEKEWAPVNDRPALRWWS